MRVRRRQAAGFTIIEMMVVLTILGLAMTAAPALVSSINGSRLRAASDDLIAGLREARNQAVRTGSSVEVVFDLRQRRYATSYQPGGIELPPIVDRVELSPAGLVDPNGVARFRFQADGSTAPVRIALWNSGGSTMVVLDWLTGRIGSGG